jgi:hypothetical protein
MNHKWLIACVLMVSTWACAQTPWPAGQAENYPMVREMQLVRHDQSVLLGELDMQTGLFYSFLGATSVEKTQNLLIADAAPSPNLVNGRGTITIPQNNRECKGLNR